MKYVFLGSPRFAATILQSLLRHDIAPVAVITNPDKPTGRSQLLSPTAVKRLILASKPSIPIHCPIKPEEISDILDQYNADLALVAAYSHIIKSETIKKLPQGVIGIHPSMLPRYRGASPIQTAILNGDADSGVSLYLLDEKMDHGPILAQEQCSILNMPYMMAEDKMAQLGAELVIANWPKIAEMIRLAKPQNHALATFTKKFSTQDAFVELKTKNQNDVWQKLLAFTPEPGLWTLCQGKRLKILNGKMENNELIITRLQYEGKTAKDSNIKFSDLG